jgi:hypothetical protein
VHAPEHLVNGALQAQVPPLQVKLVLHATPQLPQLVGSVETFVQMPPHIAKTSPVQEQLPAQT